MRRKLGTFTLVVAMLAGVSTFNYYFHRPPVTEAALEEQAGAESKIAQADGRAAELKKAAAATAAQKNDAAAKTTPLDEVPDVFKLEFACSNGTFVAEFHKDWAPIGVGHIYDLAKDNFYDEARFFRVIPGFMAQFGLAADPEKTAKWSANIKDDPVKAKNTRGMITFAKTGLPNSRSTQLFINYGDNSNLDATGFAPIGKVLTGMDVVDAIHSGYREAPQQGQITQFGNDYLKKTFPNLDYIKTIKLVDDKATEGVHVHVEGDDHGANN